MIGPNKKQQQKTATYIKISPKMVNPRDLGTHKKPKKKPKKKKKDYTDSECLTESGS